MANKKFVVKSSAQERVRLSDLIAKGRTSAKVILKAGILLEADTSKTGEGWADEDICTALSINVTIVARVRGAAKVFCHLMLGIVVITVEQLMRLVQ